MREGVKVLIDVNELPRIFALIGIMLIGASGYRPSMDTPISDFCFFLTFLFSFILINNRLSIDLRVLVGASLVAVGGLLSSPYASNPGNSFLQLAKFVFVFLVLLVLIPNLFTTRRHFERICWAALVSGALNASAAIIEYRVGHHLFASSEGLEWRMLGLSGHANELGDHCALMALVGFYLMRSREKIVLSLIALALTVTCLIGVMLSVSIGASLAVCVGVAVYAMLQRSLRIILTIGVLATVLGLLYSNLFQVQQSDGHDLKDRISVYSENSTSGTTLGSRIETYNEAISTIRNNPFIGVGNDEASALTRGGYEVHNIFLLAWYQTGVLGFLGIFLIIFSPFSRLWKRYRDRKLILKHVVCSMLALWVGAVLIDSESPAFVQRINWLPFSIISIFLFNWRKWPTYESLKHPDRIQSAVAHRHA